VRDLNRVGFGLPFARAFGTGLFVGLASLGLGLALHWLQSWAIALLAGAIGALISWWHDWGVFHLLVEWLHAPQEVEPIPAPVPIHNLEAAPIPVSFQEGRRVQFMRFIGVSDEHLHRLADELTMGASFTNAYWDPRVTRAEFETFRNELEQRGWAKLRRSDPQGGYELTEQGMEGLRQIAQGFRRSEPTSPSAPYGYYERVN